ncbi:MAG: hypothetical protein H7287_12275 [Thermoleophilia bacterium]|nr:hypothetical protein [Thermoleophilia bacterium]
MRRARLLASLFLLIIVALPASSALAAEPNAVDDPVAIFSDDTAVVGGADDAAVAGIAEATVEEAPAVAAAPAPAPAPAATAAPAASSYRGAGTRQLPFTGMDSGLIPVISLLGSLLLIGGGLLYVAAGSERRDELTRG